MSKYISFTKLKHLIFINRWSTSSKIDEAQRDILCDLILKTRAFVSHTGLGSWGKKSAAARFGPQNALGMA
jgi:hypothetical protein